MKRPTDVAGSAREVGPKPSRSVRAPVLAGLAVLIALVRQASCRADSPGPVEVRESFAGRSLDRARWMVDGRGPQGVKVNLRGGALHFVVPAGPSGRPPVALRSLFGLEGDFDIRADYEARSFPRPRKDWASIEIFVTGLDGAAAVIRTNHASLGPGYSLWCELAPGRVARGAWKHVPTRDRAGTLRIERVGRELRYWTAEPGGGFRALGSTDFGDGPIRQVEFRATVPDSKEALDFSLDNVAVRAGRLTARAGRSIEPPAPSVSIFGAGIWVCGILAPLAAATAWFLFRKTRRSWTTRGASPHRGVPLSPGPRPPGCT